MIRINHLLCIDEREGGLFLSRGGNLVLQGCVRLAACVVCGEDFWVMNSGAAANPVLSELRYLRKSRCD